MTGQPFVHEGVLGAVELEQAPVLLHQVVKEELGLSSHRPSELAAVVGEAEGVRAHSVQVLQAQPQRREASRQGFRAGVRQEPAGVQRQSLRVGQLPGLRGIEQLVVRIRSPEEEREAGGQVFSGQQVRLAGADSLGLPLHAEEEVGAGQDRFDGCADARLEAAFFGAKLVEFEQGVCFVRVRFVLARFVPAQLAAVCRLGQARHDLSGAGKGFRLRGGPAGEDAAAGLEVGHAGDVARSFHGQAGQVGRRRGAVAGLGAREGPVVGADQVLVRTVHAPDERRRHPSLSGPHEHRLGADGEPLAALEVDPAAVAHQGCALPVHRDVHVVEPLAPARHEAHRERVLAVGGEGVEDADSSPGAVGRVLGPLPFVL